MAVDVAADVEADEAAHLADGVEEAFFQIQHQFFVHFGRHLTDDGVADAYGVGAVFDLRVGEFDGVIDAYIHEIAAEGFPVDQVHHKIGDAAQIGGFGGGSFHPAGDGILLEAEFFECFNGINSI